MVQPAGEPHAPSSLSDAPDPSWSFLMHRGLPTFVVEGFVPVLLFYSLWKVAGARSGDRRSDSGLRCDRLVAGPSGT